VSTVAAQAHRQIVTSGGPETHKLTTHIAEPKDTNLHKLIIAGELPFCNKAQKCAFFLFRQNRVYTAVMLRDECPVSIALRVISGKWKPLILRELKEGTLRYSQLHRRIPEASQKVLTSQLRQLEREGIVERRVYPESILRTQYTLTKYGRTLRPALLELARWGHTHTRRPRPA
jgi:DNA-binding HxlR family transcriptional regulator